MHCNQFAAFFFYNFILIIIILKSFAFWVFQQCKVIKDQTDFRVEEYFGGKGVDDWDDKVWEKEISEHDVSFQMPNFFFFFTNFFWIELED